jgi:hypothetical protein
VSIYRGTPSGKAEKLFLDASVASVHRRMYVISPRCSQRGTLLFLERDGSLCLIRWVWEDHRQETPESSSARAYLSPTAARAGRCQSRIGLRNLYLLQELRGVLYGVEITGSRLLQNPIAESDHENRLCSHLHR